MSEEILELVRAQELLAPGRPVLVLFSGGRDSTCLLDLAVRIAGTAPVSALHVNYGVRENADRDERQCAEVSRNLGVALEVIRPRRPEVGNLQAWARAERYRAAKKLAAARGADVAAGHTATDQVETILYRLASSPSRRALLGMKPREPLPGASDRWLVRPLLGVTRAQTAGYCAERGLTWREDETNASPTYARGRVRADLVPTLQSIHPAAVENVLALAETLRDEAEVLEALVDQVLGGRDEIDLKRLRGLSPALARLVLQRLADRAAGRPAPGTARRAEEVAGMGDDAMLDLPHGVRAVAEAGVLRFVRQPDDARGDRNVRPDAEQAPGARPAVGRHPTGAAS